METELEYWRVQLQGLPALQALRLLSHTISDYYPILSQLTSYSISPYFHLAFADFAGHLSSLEMSRRTAGAYRLCAASNTTLGWWSGAPPQKKKHMFHGGLLQQNSNGSNGLESLLCISTSLQFH